MTRKRRIVVPGMPHHITHRGHRGADIFGEDNDRLVYLSMLRKYSARYGLSIWAYCLMSNHIHLVARPDFETSLSKTIRETHTAYAVWFNRKSDVSGHLWHGRYFSCVLEEPHMWAAVRYVERNPVHAGIVKNAEQYAWSSASAHCGLRDDMLVAREFPIGGRVSDWRKWLAEEDVGLTDLVRRATLKGHPSGSAEFVAGVERLLDVSLTPRKRGRRTGWRKRKPPSA